jgi:pimeloyl-ACP methyl ester carboxylesterase
MPTPHLHVTKWGNRGDPITLVHGGFGWGEECWAEQRPLAPDYRLLLVDRCGHGRSLDIGRNSFQDQADDILAVAAQVVHLVGQSYGALVCLVAALRSPNRVRSLTVIEPPAWSLLESDPYVQAMVAKEQPIFAAANQLGPERAYARFIGASDVDADRMSLSEMDRKSISATFRQPYALDAPVSAQALGELDIPALVVSGGRPPDASQERRDAGIAYRRICDRLEDLLNAQRAHLPFGAHNPQMVGEPFNATLRVFLEAV